MGGHDRPASRWIAVLAKNRLPAIKNAYKKHAGLDSIVEYIIYLLTPESTIKTGFEKITHNRIDPGAGRRGLLKIIFCLLLSILLGLFIAKLA